MAEPPSETCPQCGASGTLARLLDTPGGAELVAEPRPPRVPASQFGCLRLLMITGIAVLAAIVIGLIAQFTTAAPASDLRPGDTAAFTGSVVLMVVFVGLFSVLTWRQVRGDAALRAGLVRWREAQARRAALRQCSACGRVSLPGKSRALPPDEAGLLLYD